MVSQQTAKDLQLLKLCDINYIQPILIAVIYLNCGTRGYHMKFHWALLPNNVYLEKKLCIGRIGPELKVKGLSLSPSTTACLGYDLSKSYNQYGMGQLSHVLMIPALSLSNSCYEDQMRSYKWTKKCYTKWIFYKKKTSHSSSNGLPSNSNSEDQKLNPWLKGQLTNMAAEASNLLLFLPGHSTSSTNESDFKKQMTSGS